MSPPVGTATDTSTYASASSIQSTSSISRPNRYARAAGTSWVPAEPVTSWSAATGDELAPPTLHTWPLVAVPHPAVTDRVKVSVMSAVDRLRTARIGVFRPTLP